MACEHCLRGDAQNLNMSKKVIDASLEGVSSIYMLTFSGGEPSLNVSAIEYAIKVIRDKNIGVVSFYVATNGAVPSIRLAKALLELYSMVDEPESCGLAWSNDEYHTAKEPLLYKGLSFFHHRISDTGHSEYSPESLINEGRAYENGLSSRPDYVPESLTVSDEEGEFRTESTVYVSANGHVMTDCDCSFNRIDRENVGNVLNDSLENILRRVVKKAA